MDSPLPDGADVAASESRATRLARRRLGWRRRALLSVGVLAMVAGGTIAAYALVWSQPASTPTAEASGTSAGPSSTRRPTTTTAKPTTTTTVRPVRQPANLEMPSPGGGLGWGSRGPVVEWYETRMQQLHFDPGPVDGVFDQRTQYAVVAVQKYVGLPRTGVIDTGVQMALTKFRYVPAKPKAEARRVEIDLDRQVLTAYDDWQPVLVTTTSTGNGEHFCGGVDGCQYAITPTGHYHFYELYRGWQKGKLGTMYNPYYFNGSIAVHGLDSVPSEPASHGCARIPIHIAEYFPTLVERGESIYVVGTPMTTGSGYVGPVRTSPLPPPTTVTTAPLTTAARPTTTVAPASTTPPTTVAPKTTTTGAPASTSSSPPTTG